MWNSILSSGLNTIGITPMHLAQLQGIVIANQLFLKGMEKSDIYLTKKLFGVEESLKSEQDWYYIKQKTQPVFDVLNFGLSSVTNTNIQPDEQIQELDQVPIAKKDTKLVYTET